MMDNINIQKILEEKQVLKVGELTQQHIDKLGLKAKPRNIKFAYDRVSHCKKHINDFKDITSYNKSMANIPNIIKNPDYIGYNQKNNGIEYIKRLDDVTLVAIRLKSNGDLFLRSIYPISESKLNNGIKSNRIKKL